jgi:hypothetical protein
VDATQAWKRKPTQPQAQIELFDSEDNESRDGTASANLNGTEGTDTEFSDAKND